MMFMTKQLLHGHPTSWIYSGVLILETRARKTRHIHTLHINQHLSPQWTSSADHVDCSVLSHAVEHATIPDCEGYSWLLVFLHNLLRFSGKTEIHSQAPYLFLFLFKC